MDKRTFIKSATVLTAGAVCLPWIGCTSEEVRTNWAQNLTYQAREFHRPRSVEQVQELIAQSPRIRPLGSRHCFNRIADTEAVQLSIADLPLEVAVDGNSVHVPGGMRYGELVPHLDAHGMALHNLASLPHISVAGACSTATHGSGMSSGNLATAVTALDIVRADGELVTLSRDRDDDRFAGAVVALGCLGVVTRVSLATEPAYAMGQQVYLDASLDAFESDFDAIMGQGYSVSLFTDWQTQASSQIWVKRRVEEGLEFEPTLFGAPAADRKVHPVLALDAQACTEQLGQQGAWHARLPHFKMEFTPSSGRELQSEFFVDRTHAPAVIAVLRRLADQLNPLLMISEARTIAADDLWLSTAYGRDSVAFHFTWHQHWEALQALLPRLESALEPFNPRPHWGKNFGMAPITVQSRYDRLADFRTLAEEFDPNGKFRNAFVDAYLF